MKFVAKAAGGLYDPYQIKSKVWIKWETILQDFNTKAPVGVNRTL